ncbi:TetR/AcrR family transcriptional regulator [Variovorax sp. WS11]|uniref:TetR/AcrR family transcriptional regulator n=1 Tax=Variovorax sp. WS11 TaxID=1105204 RepID=UPI000D0CBF0E|nr:TetR/AcrR family transcriptional regulator [Variovorax sp. WS11]NDZ18976.1 TetR/AcrR family transcriptional regulator [Variovorax sp. WS11]PSL82484.1 TetR/AcrR family transcriptional regulator [Variovorax sp. WS11]
MNAVSRKVSGRRRSSGLANEIASRSVRERILAAAVQLLIEKGVARTTTLQVQHAADVSRGALLHHFPTHAQLLSATVEELVRRNEQSVHESLARLQGTEGVVERAIRALSVAAAQPAYMAELELWAIARADSQLRASLLQAERRARKEQERVLGLLFAPMEKHPSLPAVISTTTEFIRGLALSGVLSSPVRRQKAVSHWIGIVKSILEQAK